MKIANIMIARGLGGIEQAFLDYNNALLSQDFDVLAITDKRAQINEKITPHQNLKHLNFAIMTVLWTMLKKSSHKLKTIRSWQMKSMKSITQMTNISSVSNFNQKLQEIKVDLLRPYL